MNTVQENQFQEVFDAYALTWGPVRWRSRCAAIRRTGNDVYAAMLHALAAVETDSVMTRKRVHAIRADRADALTRFHLPWLAEEAEHADALRTAAGALGTLSAAAAPRRGSRRPRALVTWPALYAGGLLMPHAKAVYCALGTMQEYIALTTYRRLGEMLGDPALDDMLRAIAWQESQHMKFFRNCALILLDAPGARRTARVTVSALWRPPGIGLLGLDRWLKVFGPLLRDPVYAARLARVDGVFGDLIEDHSVTPMSTFLAKVRPRLYCAEPDGPVPAGTAACPVGGRRG
jgi:hypothetical protein